MIVVCHTPLASVYGQSNMTSSQFLGFGETLFNEITCANTSATWLKHQESVVRVVSLVTYTIITHKTLNTKQIGTNDTIEDQN